MRKEPIIFLLLALSLAGMILASCSRSEERLVRDTLLEADALNENSDLGGLTYMQPSSLTAEEARRYTFDHPETVFQGDHVYGYYYQYPYDSGNRYLTQITIRGGSHHVYGVSIGDDVTNAGERLEQMGYSNNGHGDVVTIRDAIVYEKHDVRIYIIYDIETQTILEIWISTDTHDSRTNFRY